MDKVDFLVEKYFGSSSRGIRVGGLPVEDIVEKYSTPLFVYDGHIMDTKFDLLRQTLPSEFSISYSVKANPNPFILRHFLSKGCGLEIASAGEFYLALDAGCPPQKILFAGPGKTEHELEFVLRHGIGEIHVESMKESERISCICNRLGKKAEIGIRVNLGEEALGGAVQMGGKPTPFGIDEEILEEVMQKILADSSLVFRGLHFYMGTQILDHDILSRQYRKGLEIVRLVSGRLQQPLHTVDFGGGFGIPYFANEHELDMDKFSESLNLLMAGVRNDPLFRGTQFMVEPGRYLVGEAGIYVTRINDIKISRGKKFVVVDGGMNHHLAASGNLGQVIRRNYPIALLNKLNEEHKEKVDIVGPLCTSLDVFGKDVNLPSPEIGDLLGIFQSGAYARTASPLGFLSHQTPPEVFVYNGKMSLIRHRGTYDDLLLNIPPL